MVLSRVSSMERSSVAPPRSKADGRPRRCVKDAARRVKLQRRWARNLAGLPAIALLANSAAANAQTPEQDLQRCIIQEVNRYQPVSPYSQEFQCSVGNKKPFKSTPGKTLSGSVRYSGYIILSADAVETFKISDGGHTSPFILPNNSAATLAYWCKAEDKDYGKSGKYNVRVFGQRQRVATELERRRALTKCTQAISLVK